MARPRAADYDERRAAIIAQAARLFARRGFNGTSVADIASGCDMSKSLLYHYYPSKEDLLYEVMSSHVEMLFEEASACERIEGTASNKLKALLTTFMGHYHGAADAQKVLLNELHNLPAERRATIVSHQREIVDCVQRLLLEARPDCCATPALARARTMLLFGMLNWTMNWYKPDGPVATEALLDMMVEMALGEGSGAS
ncbi:TetR/AcrR family transcriptional regulator [Aurantiacibacter sediminis]|uniref:TetR family transcriptional regulator n=1 Tax=Aurantiacibacter sediminis TaxID=2793064 RepID=A0ABS0N6R8_9SPHN|nr:TetR/AcrR family transcriptional regulator [Aurantiacibacter sediminis]MBH5323450.1 TetR family transcriptional regulator [Aurantiacibacter sediminis]